MRESIREALSGGFTEAVRDGLWGHIYLTGALAELTKSAPFLRLHRILQLGPAYRLYPGATHTRGAHSLGVCHLARRILLNLAEQGADAWLSPAGARSFLCAALLHDLGHFPYTHSLKELPLEDHEVLTGKIILREPVKSLVAAAGADPDFTAAIVNTSLPGDDRELQFYRRLLSGALDPDKLDYLNRDAWYCGIPYGAQDVDFILSRLHPAEERGADIDSRGIPSVESVLFSKYLMYRTVYWHRQVRSATAMVKKALQKSLEQALIAPEELYDLDDQSLFALLKDRSQPLFALADQVREGQLYVLAAEFPFDRALHGDLLDLSRRSLHENALAEELSRKLRRTIAPEELIIDIPEAVSFETGLYVSDEERYFADSSSAFNAGMVDSLIKSLYIVRIFVDRKHETGVKSYSDSPQSLLNFIKN
ncbi:phosphohydrolase [Spirochaetia bacterium]|nr:phosphohydrolase [Spirochaetia bacterium]